MMSGFSRKPRLGESLLLVLAAAVMIALAVGAAVQADECDGLQEKPCGDGVYYSDSAVRNIYISGNGTIKDYFFAETDCKHVIISDKVTIGASAFEGCTSLRSVEAPFSVTIKESAFARCSSLEKVVFNNAESVGTFAFAGCTSLTKIDLPSAVTVGDNAFLGCSSLKSVSIPSAVSIEFDAFVGCISLSSITIPASVTSIGNGAFSDVQFYAPPSSEPLAKNAESLRGYEYRGSNGSLYRYGEVPASFPPAEETDRTPVIAAAAVLAAMAAAMTASFVLKRKP